MPETQKQKEEQEKEKAGVAYAAGISLFAIVAGCTGIGWLADRWFGTQPWLLVVGIVLGSAAGLFEFVRLSNKTY
jgi:ATP synthase protein I